MCRFSESTAGVVVLTSTDVPWICSPDACLSSQVPNLELEVLVGDLLNVEADGGDGSHNLADLKPDDLDSPIHES